MIHTCCLLKVLTKVDDQATLKASWSQKKLQTKVMNQNNHGSIAYGFNSDKQRDVQSRKMDGPSSCVWPKGNTRGRLSKRGMLFSIASAFTQVAIMEQVA